MAEADAELDDEIEIGPDDIEDDVDAEIEVDDDPDQVEAEPEERKLLSRSQREIIKLRKRTQDAENRATRAEEASQRNSGAIEVLTRTQTGPTPEQQRAEQEKLESMTSAQQVEYLVGKERQQIQGAFQQRDFQTGDLVDSLKFERLCDKNPAYAKVADEVEKRMTEMRKQGFTAPRQNVANTIIGERTAARAGKPARQETVKRARVSSGGSDVTVDRGRQRTAKTSKDRLEGVKF